MKTQSIAMVVVGILLTVALSTTRAAGDHAASANPFEPTVTRKESELLSEVTAVAATNLAQAVERLASAIDEESSPALPFALANLYYRQEAWSAAIKAYRQALDKMPTFRAAAVNLGRVYLLEDQPEKTIEVYQHLVENGQADANLLLLLGHALLMTDATISAETAYRQALLLRPNDQDARLGLTKSLVAQQRYAEGIALLDEVLVQSPLDSTLWALKANAQLSLDRMDDAVSTLESARRLGCADSDMLALLGDLYLNRDLPAEASAVYQQAFKETDADPQRLLRAVEGFLMIGDVDSADPLLARADSLKGQESWPPKDDIRLLRLRGELAQHRGDTEQAVEQYQALLERDPLDGRTMLLLAGLLREQDRLEDAVMMCERAARVEDFEADALVLQAQMEVDRERYARAAELLETAQAFESRPHVQRYLEQIRRLGRGL